MYPVQCLSPCIFFANLLAISLKIENIYLTGLAHNDFNGIQIQHLNCSYVYSNLPVLNQDVFSSSLIIKDSLDGMILQEYN